MNLLRLSSPFLLCLVTALAACSDRQDLLASTPPLPGGEGVAGNAGAAGGANAGAGAIAARGGNAGNAPDGGAGTNAQGGKQGGGAGKASAPPEPLPYPQACPPNAPHPTISEEIIACGLPPGTDLAAIDDDGIVFYNTEQGYLRRLDRQTGAVSLLREEPLGGAWNPELHGPSRDDQLFLVDQADARLFTVDQRTGKAKTLGYGVSLPYLVLGPSHVYGQLQDGVNFSSHGPIGRFAYGKTSAGSKVSKVFANPVAVDGGYVYFEDQSKRLVRRVPEAGGIGKEADVFSLPPIGEGSKHFRSAWTVSDGQLYFVEDAGPGGTHVVAKRGVDAPANEPATPLVTFVDGGCDCAPQQLRVEEGFLLVPAFGNVTAVPLAQPSLARQIFPRTLSRLGILVDATHFYAVGTRGGIDSPLEGFIGRVARDTVLPFVP